MSDETRKCRRCGGPSRRMVGFDQVMASQLRSLPAEERPAEYICGLGHTEYERVHRLEDEVPRVPEDICRSHLTPKPCLKCARRRELKVAKQIQVTMPVEEIVHA